MNKEDLYIMWLTRIDGIGIVKQNALLKKFLTAEEIYFAKENQLSNVDGISKTLANKIVSNKRTISLNQIEEEIKNDGIRFITITNDEYPKLLKNIFDPPLGIYVSGNLYLGDFYGISIIGARRCSQYGLTVANKLAKDLASVGIVIVSGLARGIDTEAHRGALEGNGYTVAVLGNGLDISYPPENKTLMEKIQSNGILVSEYPPKTKPLPGYFPARNRIISGLSRGLIVVESGKKSGTNITVNQALDQGREVFAVPGSIFSKSSEGTNSLIKDGAVLVTNYKDILNELKITEKAILKKEEKQLSELYGKEKEIFNCISYEPITVNEVINKTGSSISKAKHILITLELKGYIKNIGGGRYIRAL